MWKVTLFVLTLLVLLQICMGTQCLACHDIVKPTDCGVVINCGIHQQCYVDNYVTANGHVRYNLGCRDTLQCGQADQADYPHSLVDKRSSGILICSECCQGPLCNSAGCGHQGYSALRGPVCYNCPDQLEVDDCETITVCGRDEVCLINQIPNPVTHEKRYQTRCELNKACFENMNMINGFQTSDQWNVDTCYIDCCTDDLCNSKCNNSNTVSTTVSMTTTSTNTVQYCQSNPCVSGTCAEYGDTYICTCDDGAWGRNCEQYLITNSPTTTIAPDMCSSNPCIYGNCSHVLSTYICDCETGYWGRHCENSLLPKTTETPTTASSVPTSSISTTPQSTTPPRTTTQTPTTTSTVQTSTVSTVPQSTTSPTTTTQTPATTFTNLCDPNPCANGECHANNSGYTCVCSSGYFGDTCDHDACATNPCQNGGTCVAHHHHKHLNSYFTCQCDQHYHGKLCDLFRTTTTTTTTTPRPDPCDPYPCVHGTCHHANNDLGYTCDCYNHYTGALCDKSVTTTTTTTTTTKAPASCLDYHCEHGGHCRVHNNQAVCLCTPDRNGEHCEHTRYCEPTNNVYKTSISHSHISSHFSFVQQTMTQSAALQYCKTHCLGTLVKIRTLEQYQTLHNFLVHANHYIHTDFWVDGRYNDNDNHWYTSSGGRMTEHHNAWAVTVWGNSGYCVRFRQNSGFVLDDFTCDSSFGLICEYHL